MLGWKVKESIPLDECADWIYIDSSKEPSSSIPILMIEPEMYK